MSRRGGPRVAVYCDDSYRATESGIFGNRAVLLFLAGVAAWCDFFVLAGQLDPTLASAYYRVPAEMEFAALPAYPSLVHPRAPWGMLKSIGRFWRALDHVEVVWLLGPHPLCLVYALLGKLRRRRVVLGVRQDFPTYARSRHPNRRTVHLAADVLEASYRLMARTCPTVVVGPDQARKYRHAKRLLQVSVSLVRDEDIVDPTEAAERPVDRDVTVLSVGRLDTEKNPLLLADVAERLNGSHSWRLVVCGEGPLEDELRQVLEERGLADRVELRGYVPIDGGLREIYRESDVFLHVSLTEGLPQVLVEASAAGLPIVATGVGGIPASFGDAGVIVPPADAEAVVEALERVVSDPALRRRLMVNGAELARGQTLERESRRVAEFLAAA